MEGRRTISTENNDKSQEIQTFQNDDGTVSSYFDKRKVRIAPRSTLQFKIGPSFTPKVEYNVVKDLRTGKRVEFEIKPRIDRGFDFIENEWIGYKRNYFTVVSAFDTPTMSLDQFLQGSYEIRPDNSHSRLKVKYFAVKLVAKCIEDQSQINLVQHTAKRDKGPQFAPPIHPLVPAPLPNHQMIREASNVRNESKMKKFDHDFFLHRDRIVQDFDDGCIIYTYPNDTIKKVARYERIQFASSITVKKPTQQSKHFVLQLVLGCCIDGNHINRDNNSPYYNLDTYDQDADTTFIPILMKQTPALIIRGRSPSNYPQQIKTLATKEETIIVETSNSNVLAEPKVAKRGRKRKEYTEDDDEDEDEYDEPVISELNGNKRVQKYDRISNPKEKPEEQLTYIEGVKRKIVPLVLQSSLTARDLELLPKTSMLSALHNSLEADTTPSFHLSPLNDYDVELLSIQYDPFNLENQAYDQHLLTDGILLGPLENRKRKLSNKSSISLLSETKVKISKKTTTAVATTMTATSHSSTSNVSFSTFHSFGPGSRDFQQHNATVTNNFLIKHISPSQHPQCNEDIPRSTPHVNNPMDISFCLNIEETPASRQRPFSGKRGIVTAGGNSKPSELLNSSDLLDEPSFFRH
ncbi:HCL417Wp [Eremothecium sinecaudum]|uniref:HCL417Wp n=1 Tax=Eremothecium sinecaudum TaxID=45286 RepID=A0A109UY98_9SACH|nr:HCL417Wp [Eremothecium sinecaudum]AMD19734.1 HCL417Wp [Eremothecium sinecaudum]